MVYLKFLMLMALCVASASAQLPGMNIFGGLFKAAADMVTQTVSLGMSLVKQAFDLVPIKEAIALSEAAMSAVADYPEKIMAIFLNAAGSVTSAAGGIANPGAEIFGMAAEQVKQMKEAGAPKEEYEDLMKKMKEAIGVS